MTGCPLLGSEFVARQNGKTLPCVRLAVENERLRELLQRTWDAFHGATAREFVTVKNDLRELGVGVDA